MRKSQKLAVKPKLEQDRVDPSVQKQTQVTGENHVKDQLMPEQRKNIGIPQIEQNLDLDLEISQDFEETSPYQEGIIFDLIDLIYYSSHIHGSLYC